MRTLLRNTATGLYFECPDKWTEDPALAFDFRFIDMALDYVHAWGLEGVELAFAFDDPETVTSVSIEQVALRYAAA